MPTGTVNNKSILVGTRFKKDTHSLMSKDASKAKTGVSTINNTIVEKHYENPLKKIRSNKNKV